MKNDGRGKKSAGLRLDESAVVKDKMLQRNLFMEKRMPIIVRGAHQPDARDTDKKEVKGLTGGGRIKRANLKFTRNEELFET